RHAPQSLGIELSLDDVIAILASRIGKQIRERAGSAVFALEWLFERALRELNARETVELIVGITGALDKLVTRGLAVIRLLKILPGVLDRSELTHRPVRQDHGQCELGHEALHHASHPPGRIGPEWHAEAEIVTFERREQTDDALLHKLFAVQ